MSSKTDNKESNLEQFFQPLDVDNNEVTEIPSMCVNCLQEGLTKLMLTKIPFFRDVIVSSFECSHCGYKNSELSSAMEISAVGVEYELQVKEKVDLNRTVVKSDYALVKIPELELETTPKCRKAEVTTVKGIIHWVLHAVSEDQGRWKEEHPEIYEQIEKYLKRVEDCLALNTLFTVTIRDISGNSFIGGRPGTLSIVDDPNLTSKKFERSKSENEQLGLQHLPSVTEEVEGNFKDDVLRMPTKCLEWIVDDPNLTSKKYERSKSEYENQIYSCWEIPIVQKEVYAHEGMEAKGISFKLTIKSPKDMKRRVLMSDTCKVIIESPEVHLVAANYIADFTTIEGLISDIKRSLFDDRMIDGDAFDIVFQNKIDYVNVGLERLLTGGQKFTLILDDPAGNCYMEKYYAPEDDPELETEEYERSYDQNEDLGLNDMNVGPQELS